jgi:hypothetical protein
VARLTGASGLEAGAATAEERARAARDEIEGAFGMTWRSLTATPPSVKRPGVNGEAGDGRWILFVELDQFGNYPKLLQMRETRIAFQIASFAFTLVVLGAISLSGYSNPVAGPGMTFFLCGGIYLYGSCAALRGELPLSALVLSGTVLNIFGIIAWIPYFLSPHSAWIAWTGIGLTLGWLVSIGEEYRAKRH